MYNACISSFCVLFDYHFTSPCFPYRSQCVQILKILVKLNLIWLIWNLIDLICIFGEVDLCTYNVDTLSSRHSIPWTPMINFLSNFLPVLSFLLHSFFLFIPPLPHNCNTSPLPTIPPSFISTCSIHPGLLDFPSPSGDVGPLPFQQLCIRGMWHSQGPTHTHTQREANMYTRKGMRGMTREGHICSV